MIKITTESEMVQILRSVLEECDEYTLFADFADIEEQEDEDEDTFPDVSCSTFEEVGLMTSNRGLVVRVGDSEFQITVVRSR